LSDFLLDLHQSLAHQGLAKSLDISIGMPTLFANLAASRSWHISSQKIAQLRYRSGIGRSEFFYELFIRNTGQLYDEIIVSARISNSFLLTMFAFFAIFYNMNCDEYIVKTL